MKKYYLSIIMLTVMAMALILGGCSSDRKSKEASADDKRKETDVPEAVETVPEAAAADNAEAAAEDAVEPAAKDAIPFTKDWTVVLDTEITHATNIGGFLNEQFGVTVGYGGEIHYTEDGAKTWPQAQNTSMCRYCLDIVDENLMWCGGNGGNVRVSKDGGKTWSAVTDINLGGLHINIDFIDETTGWLATSKKIVATKDGGSTWTELTYPEDVKGIAAVFLRTPEEGYLLSNNGLFYTTKDGGTSWSRHELNFAGYGITSDIKGTIGLYRSDLAQADISFTDDKNGIIVFTGTKPGEGNLTMCLTTSDGGETWKEERMDLAEGFTPVKVYLSGDGKYLTLGSRTNQFLVYKHND
jgi:photosystem II stability/assembly factor-like uncharacterized protein